VGSSNSYGAELGPSLTVSWVFTSYLRNVVRVITEAGLRIYKELTPMRKDQVDLENKVVWIPDSKTPNGVAEGSLTDLAVLNREFWDSELGSGTVLGQFLPGKRRTRTSEPRETAVKLGILRVGA
jgi:hypothetical protein